MLINPVTSTATQAVFNNLEPATYVIRYNYTYIYPWSEICDNAVYDTVVVSPYVYPNLSQSAVYQCNNNNFSLNGVATNGIAPFMYEIIGSTPATPSINTTAQASPIFNIGNGTTYSLVRLRAVDACGNAALGDVSVLPLANTIITSSNNCYYNNITLTIGAIPNATYTWYKKASATDSILLNTGSTHNIPYMLPSDTGLYVCKTSVNNGCLTRISYFRVTGACSAVLNNNGVALSGKSTNGAAELTWSKNAGQQITAFTVERSFSANGGFTALGIVQVANPSQSGSYMFTDDQPGNNLVYYRLVLKNTNGTVAYSNTVAIKFSGRNKPSVYPNPVTSTSTIRFYNTAAANYNLDMFNAKGQRVYQKQVHVSPRGAFAINKSEIGSAGMYILKISNPASGETDAVLIKVE